MRPEIGCRCRIGPLFREIVAFASCDLYARCDPTILASRGLPHDDCVGRSSGHASTCMMSAGEIATGWRSASAARARSPSGSCSKIVCGAESHTVVSSKKTDIQRSLVESGSSVCYFLMARGVAQLGSAPALGAGGRPFKSARPDTRQ